MMDTVPAKSDHDYGSSYIRLVSTYIPRLVWPDKPIFGREQWVNAWIAGSESKRDENFTGPAIGILGATQLNGGAAAPRSCSPSWRSYPHSLRLLPLTPSPWVQAWWALTYYNAWLMTVNDDPFIWFYYV